MTGSSTGSLKNVTVLVFGSRVGMSSLSYSGEPNSGPLALTVGLRRSEEIKSCMYVFSFPHSQVVITTFRSAPCGRGGVLFGSSPLAMLSVHLPRDFKGAAL